MTVPVYNKSILLLLILFSVSVAVTGMIIIPTIRDIRKLNEDTLNLMTYLEQRSENVQNLRQSLQQSQSIREEVFAYDDNLYRDGDELKLITLLEDTADKNKVLQKIENSNLDENKNNQYAVISLTITGDYHNVLNYIANLENEKYFININNITILSSVNTITAETTKNAEAHLTISLYVSK